MPTIPTSLYDSDAWIEAVDDLRRVIDEQTLTGRTDVERMQLKVDVLSKMKEDWLTQRRSRLDERASQGSFVSDR